MAKILHISQRYSPAIGGAENYMKTIAEWNVKNGHDVTVWTSDALDADALWNPTKKKVKKLEENINGVKVRRFKTSPFFLNNFFFNKGFRYVLWHSPSWFLQCFGSPPTVIGMFMQLLKKDIPKYDIIHVSAMPYNSLFYVGMKLAKKLDAKFYITPFQHVGVVGKYVMEDKYYHPRVLPFFRNADKIFIQTESEREEISKFLKKYSHITNTYEIVREGLKTSFVENISSSTPKILVVCAKISLFCILALFKAYGFLIKPFRKKEKSVEFDETKFVKVGLGIFPKDFKKGNGNEFRKKYKIEKDTPIVFTVGAKALVKGVKGTIDAMEILWKRGVSAKLVLAGDFTGEFEILWKDVSEIVKKNTLCLGRISDEDRVDLYDAGDIFCMVSKSESFGIVYLESWMYKKPVIGCNIGSVKEVISEGEDGYLAEFDDSKRIAVKIEKLLNNPKLRKEFGENGYKKVMENYTWENKFKILQEYF